MSYSYDPPEPSFDNLVSDALDELEEQAGGNPVLDAAELLHRALVLHGQRHQVGADGQEVVLRMPTQTALTLALLLKDALPEGPVGSDG
ncbi:hypothetical protein [Streptomyces sp. NPDC004296]|uniref:hypothetical protein n=1 Tax=Streptomyces sp. NPDC004296 TaxID=3364697 RepID=UPI0036BEA8AE